MGAQWKQKGREHSADAKGKLFTKLARELMVASRTGGPDPTTNSRLRLAIEQARRASMTRDTLERATRLDLLDLPDQHAPVARQHARALRGERHVLIDEYERNLVDLVTQTKPLVKGLVLMTPFYLEPNRQDAMRAAMDRYGAVVRKVAAAQGAILVDTQAAFDKVLEVYYPAAINWDRVHPNPTGSAVLARAFLASLGFDWNRGL